MPEQLPPDTPEEVVARAARGPRVPVLDPRVGRGAVAAAGGAKHRLVAIGDSLTHGFQSGAIFNTDISYPALIARALGSFDAFRYPKYGGPSGGMPINVEYLLRDLEERYGPKLDLWEIPRALFRVRQLMDGVEDYWERGAGSVAPDFTEINHNLGMFGWDLRDALGWTAERLAEAIEAPNDDALNQLVENYSARAALRVYPHSSDDRRKLTQFGAAEALGADGGIETLVVFLGANNALGVVTRLEVAWSGEHYKSLNGKSAYTVWRPEHFIAELDELRALVERIAARHVIWVTVPHVTIAPIARGVGRKVNPGSRYFPYYTRPWIDDESFDPRDDPHITDLEARAVDYAIDMYNDAITDMVAQARDANRDWYLFDVAGVLDRLAHRRYIADPDARPPWWTPYPLPPAVAALSPAVDSQFLTADGNGGRATGGLFSLDGIHPTTVGYGLIAQELINILRIAGVDCRDVDFEHLIQRDSLITQPPQNLRPGLATLGWADEALDWIKRALGRR